MFVWILFALGLVFGPIIASVLGASIGGFTAAIMIGSGIVLLVIAGALLVITKLYVKTKADEAFVRTGQGKLKVIMDGGAIVIPVVHEVIRVPLRTFPLVVQRRGADALLTADKLRADIKAEFFVRVQPLEPDITNAARSLGDRTEHEDAIRKLIEDKLVSALRTVAATKTLADLNGKRDDFVRAVMEFVTADLKHNGFTLETVTISQLDQADATALKKDNVFDAEGLATIAKITQVKQTEANGITRDQERAREQQNVDTKKMMLALQQDQARAEAEQKANIEKLQAEQGRLAKEAQIKADQAVQEAGFAKQSAVEVAKQKAEEAQQVAEQAKARAVEVASQTKQQAVEVASREREIAIAQKEKERADAEAEQLAAEKEKEANAQAVETVKVVAAAERAQQQQVIAAKAKAETTYVEQQRAADGEAYKLKTLADGKKAAAEADAEAITKKAQAEATAAQKRAEGEKATQLVPVEVKQCEVEVNRAAQMIPVDVAAKQVEVDKRRVDEVLKPELEAREKSGKVAQDFELARLRIDAEARVRIETAKASIEFGKNVHITSFGTTEDVARIQRQLTTGAGFATVANGFFATASEETQGAVAGAGQAALGLLQSIAQHLGVKSETAALPAGDGKPVKDGVKGAAA